MRHDHYILEGKQTKPVSHLTWAEWFQTADLTIKKTRAGDVLISTVFLGLNHNWLEDEPPLLFETLVMGGEFDGEMMRYSTYEEASAGHALVYDKVFPDDSILEAEEISPILDAEIIY